MSNNNTKPDGEHEDNAAQGSQRSLGIELLAGGFASAASNLVCSPFQRVKIMMQLQVIGDSAEKSLVFSNLPFSKFRSLYF